MSSSFTGGNEAILRKLGTIEERQNQVLLALSRLDRKDGEHTSDEVESLVSELRDILLHKSPTEANALLSAIRGVLRGGITSAPAAASVDSHHATVLASYSPSEVVYKFSHIPNPRPPTEPERDDFLAAVGFVDVSGFTKLSEKLAKEHGRKGAELLNAYINAYFAKLIKGINMYAGDVIKFAGDALQVVWRNRGTGPQESATMLMLRSAACCLYLLDKLNNFSPAEGVSLTLHMGVGVGQMSAFYVGGQGNKWEYFVAGEPIEQMSDAAEEATSGQLVLSAPALAAFSTDPTAIEKYQLKGRTLSSGQYLLEDILHGYPPVSAVEALIAETTFRDGLRDALTVRAKELEPVLRCFVPQLVEERLDAGQRGVLVHEHRKLVSVFMKVVGLGPKPADVYSLDLVHRATRATQHAIQRYDGTITRLITDDKGTRFLIAFGLPGHQHEDDEQRAVNSAVEVVSALDTIPAWDHDQASSEEQPSAGAMLKCAIGITTGQVFCGEAGWELNRVEYTLAGAKVNLAARLMQAASKMVADEGRGVILVDIDTYKPSAECGADWEVHEPIMVKGKSEPVPIFQPRMRDSKTKRQISLRDGIKPRMSKVNPKYATLAASLELWGWQPLLKTCGRQLELDALHMKLRSLQVDGKGGVVIIAGDGGMGKTHMIAELRAYFSSLTPSGTAGRRTPFLRQTCVLVNTSKGLEKTTPFFMWQAIFERFFSAETLKAIQDGSSKFAERRASITETSPLTPGMQLPVSRSRQRWKNAITTVLAYQCPGSVQNGQTCVIRPQVDEELLQSELMLQHAPLLNPVLPIKIADNEFTKQLSGEARKEQAINVMCHVLQAKLGGSRMLVMFDDVHWMDASSWQLLAEAMDRVQPMLVVLTTRPQPVNDEAPELKAIKSEYEKLSDLTRADIEELMRSFLCVSGRVQLALSSAVTTRSGGNPFFAKGFIQSMLEQGVLNTSADEVNLAAGCDIGKIEWPSSVETLITSRIDRLPVGEQLILKVAAVLSPMGHFNQKQLEPMLEKGSLELPPGSTIRGILKNLQDADFLSVDLQHSKPGEPSFQFKHVSVHEVAGSILSIELQTQLHTMAAQDVEARRAGKPDSALTDEQIQMLVYHWKGAGSESDAPKKANHYLTLAGDRALTQSSIDEASQLYSEALDIAIKEKLTDKIGPLKRRLGECELMNNNYMKSMSLLEEALVALAGEQVPLATVPENELRMKLGQIRFSRRVNTYKNYLTNFGQTNKQTMGPPPSDGPEYVKLETANAYELLSRVAMQEHNVLLGSYCAMRALTLGEELEHLTPVVARSYASLCLTSAAERRQAEANEFRELALTSCKQLGELGLLAYTLTAAAMNDAGQARWAPAVANLDRAIKESAALGAKGQWEEAISQLAHLEFYRGNFKVSRGLYDTAVASAKQRKNAKILNRCKAGIAAVLLATGEVQSALAILEETNSYGPLALALLRTGEPQKAYDMALKVKDRFKGRRTKYYLLKSFVSVAEVILSLLEAAMENQQRNKYTNGDSVAGQNGGGFLRQSTRQFKVTPSADLGATKVERSRRSIFSDSEDGPRRALEDFEDVDNLQAMAQEWIDKLAQFASVYAVAYPRMLLFKGQMQFLTGNQSIGLHLVRKCKAAAVNLGMPHEESLAKQFLSEHSGPDSKISAGDSLVMIGAEASDFFKRMGNSGRVAD